MYNVTAAQVTNDSQYLVSTEVENKFEKRSVVNI